MKESTVVVHVERLVLVEETMVYACEQGVVLDHQVESSRWEREKVTEQQGRVWDLGFVVTG